MIYLYVKTHNKTNLKYLGKTIKDPFSYKGSGTLWLRHLKEHGEDITTEIIFQSENKDEFRERAIYFSELYNVSANPDWANLAREEGQGGNTNNYKRGKGTRPNARGKTGPKNGSTRGVKRTPEQREKMSKAAKERYRKNNVWNKGKTGVYSEESIQRMKDSALNRSGRSRRSS